MDREDPTKTWGQLSTWVEQEVASAISANLVWATQRARWLATRVADHFSDEETEQIKRYGQALSGGVTPFDEEVERHLARYESNRKKMKAKARPPRAFRMPLHHPPGP